MFILNDELKQKILYPKLNTISFALMPYGVEDGGAYLQEVSLSFFGDERCLTDKLKWAPEDKLKVVFWGKEVKATIVQGDCHV